MNITKTTRISRHFGGFLVLLANLVVAQLAWASGSGPCSGPATTLTFNTPTTSQVFAAGTTSVTATGTIASETNLTTYLYLDGNSLGTIASGTFSHTASGLAPGAHQFELSASRPGYPACVGSYSNTAYRAFSIAASTPSVTVVAPASVTYPASVPFTVSISNPYAVTSVSWYVDGNLVNTTSTSPYSFSWAGGAVGSHTVYARATDAYSEVGTSASHGFTIGEGAPPSVTLSVSPTSTTAPGTIALSATTSGGAYPVSNVQFFCNSTPATGPITSPPYASSWTPIPPGSCTVTAVATDNQGQKGTSSGTAVTVSPGAAPTVSVTASTNCTTLPAQITMNATVTSAYPVTSLNFVVNGTSYAQPAQSTGSYVFSTPGNSGWGTATNYAISATAANQYSSTGTSNTVNIAEAAHPTPTVTLNSVEATDDVPAEISVASAPSDTVCGTNYAQAQLFLNGTAQPQILTAAPYNFLVNNVAAGTYAATVTVTNAGGQSATSSPQSITVASSDPTVTGDAKTQTRTIKFEYDPNIGRTNKVILEPESSNLCLVRTAGFDAFGNAVTSTTRNCNGSTPNEAAAPTDSSVIAPRTSTLTYDSTGTFPLSSTNALTQIRSATFDARFGLATSSKDANGLTQNEAFDAVGRLSSETLPDGTINKFQYLWCSGFNGGTATCPALAVYLVQSSFYAPDGSTQMAPSKSLYFDALARRIQSQVQGFNGTTIISAAIGYDSLRRVQTKAKPYFSNASPSLTTFQYDVLNRKTSQTNPLGAVTTYSYNGLETTRINPIGHKYVRTLNSQGKIISSVDALAQVSTYAYDPFGDMILSVDPQGVTKTAVYDVRGRKTQFTDPDMGTWKYVYNSAGQIVQQTDAKSQNTTFTYDLLGRKLSRTEPDLTSNWEYDLARSECSAPGGKAVGSLDREWTSTGYNKIECFDSMSRPNQERVTIGSQSFVSAIAYDASSRPTSATFPAGSVYPSGFVVTASYNSYGYVSQLNNAATGTPIWQPTTLDAAGHVLAESLANGAFGVTRTFDAVGRELTSVSGSSNSIQNDSASYDLMGNLTSRGWIDSSDVAYTESFGYDALDRLVSVTGPANKTYAYDYSGNMTQKSDIGTLAYTAGTHQLASITGTADGVINPTFTYDNNGNLSAGDGATVTWSAANMASTINRGTSSDTFLYAPEHSRTRMVSTTSSGTVTTYYPGSNFEMVVNSATGTTEFHNYIQANERRVAMLIDSTQGTTAWRYFHQDPLGSVEVVTDQTGAVVERLSYDAWGKRRNTNGTDAATQITALDTRGFTDQEQLDSVSFVNMNGRIYDPAMGRFLSADPTIPRTFDLQSHNRYSYASNRPLTRIDRTGFTDEVPASDDDDDGGGGGGGGGIIVLPPVTVIGHTNGDSNDDSLDNGTTPDDDGTQSLPRVTVTGHTPPPDDDDGDDGDDDDNGTGVQQLPPVTVIGHVPPGSDEPTQSLPRVIVIGHKPPTEPTQTLPTVTVIGHKPPADGCTPPPMTTSADRPYDPSDPATHTYTATSYAGSGLSAQQKNDLFSIWRDGMNAAPGIEPNAPDGTPLLLSNSLLGVTLGPDTNWVYLRTDPQSLTWTNVTLPGHYFADGTVTNSVITDSDGNTYLQTVGTGNTPRSWQNDVFGWAFFKASQAQAIAQFQGTAYIPRIGFSGSCNK